MRSVLRKASIICVGLLLAACSTLKLAYDNGPQLAWWWIDAYLDFNGEQTPRVKTAIGQWFEWHRSTQLGDYAALLGEAQADVLKDITPEKACRWQERLSERFEPAVERAVTLAAGIVPLLGEAQLAHLRSHYAKRNAEMREEYLQPDPAERRTASVKRAIERFETIYGRLEERQRQLVSERVASSPFDAAVWLGERERRQREALSTLRELLSNRAENGRVVAALQGLATQNSRSSDPGYREYQQRLVSYNCLFIAQLHNATTPAQRGHARRKLEGWASDLRVLGAAFQQP